MTSRTPRSPLHKPRPPRRAAGNLWQRLRRLIRFRLIIPLMRSHHSPEHGARGTLVGLVWAFTPSVGIQMPLVLITWFVARRVFKWDFNLVLGLAWTWVTNAFTALPCYYVFYLTGQVMFGHWHRLAGFDGFLLEWNATFGAEQSLLEQTIALSRVLILDWGITMLVGSIPWAALIGYLGYRYSLKFIRAHRKARAHRTRRRHAGRHAPAHRPRTAA